MRIRPRGGGRGPCRLSGQPPCPRLPELSGGLGGGGGDHRPAAPRRALPGVRAPARHDHHPVLDTHAHADHISSGAELAERLGVPYHLHPYDAIHPMDVLPATFRYQPVYDGQEFRVGRATLRAIHVPGHTLGQVVYLLDGRYLFSGDTIFVESIARPDLGGRAETWTPLYYRSLLRLMELPDSTLVLPGHFSRPQEADARGRVAARLGDLKRSNEGLQALVAGERAFVDFIMARLPEFPQQYVDIKRVNLGLLRPGEDEASELELGRNVCALAEQAA